MFAFITLPHNFQDMQGLSIKLVSYGKGYRRCLDSYNQSHLKGLNNMTRRNLSELHMCMCSLNDIVVIPSGFSICKFDLMDTYH